MPYLKSATTLLACKQVIFGPSLSQSYSNNQFILKKQFFVHIRSSHNSTYDGDEWGVIVNVSCSPPPSLPPGILCRAAEVHFSEDTTNDIKMYDEVKNMDPEALTLTFVSC